MDGFATVYCVTSAELRLVTFHDMCEKGSKGNLILESAKFIAIVFLG